MQRKFELFIKTYISGKSLHNITLAIHTRKIKQLPALIGSLIKAIVNFADISNCLYLTIIMLVTSKFDVGLR